MTHQFSDSRGKSSLPVDDRTHNGFTGHHTEHRARQVNDSTEPERERGSHVKHQLSPLTASLHKLKLSFFRFPDLFLESS